jgi:hypothetical protein
MSRCVLFAALLGSLAPLPPASALAQEAPPRERSVSLGRVLDAYATDARSTRIALALGQAGLGIAAIAPGALLLGRSDSNLQLVGTGLVVVGAVELLGVPSLFIPTNIERIDDHWATLTARGDDPAAVVRVVEVELHDAAEQRRSSRITYGVVGLVLGVAAFATGMVFVLQPAGIAGMDAQTQLVWGTALVGIGGAFVGNGLHEIFHRSPEESAWAAYAGARRPAEGSAPAAAWAGAAASVAVVPTRGGAVGAFRVAF